MTKKKTPVATATAKKKKKPQEGRMSAPHVGVLIEVIKECGPELVSESATLHDLSPKLIKAMLDHDWFANAHRLSGTKDQARWLARVVESSYRIHEDTIRSLFQMYQPAVYGSNLYMWPRKDRPTKPKAAVKPVPPAALPEPSANGQYVTQDMLNAAMTVQANALANSFKSILEEHAKKK